MVPLSEYQNRGSELDLYKHKNADLLLRTAQLDLKVAKLRTEVRKNLEAQERLRELTEIKEQTEDELEMIRSRLEALDPQFKWENEIFGKIVGILTKCKVSPAAAFQEFDVNKDGTLSRDEFRLALAKMRIQDLSEKDFDSLMRQVDTDGDGGIRYKEFVRKLQRHGVRSQTSEEQIIFAMMEALRRSKRITSLLGFFEIMDKTSSGYVSREDFLGLFHSLRLDVPEQKLEQFMEHFWKDKASAIDYKEFLRIF